MVTILKAINVSILTWTVKRYEKLIHKSEKKIKKLECQLTVEKQMRVELLNNLKSVIETYKASN